MILTFKKRKFDVVNHDKKIKIYICDTENTLLFPQTEIENEQAYALALTSSCNFPTAVITRNHEYNEKFTKAFDLSFDVKTLKLLPFGERSPTGHKILGIYLPRLETYLEYCAYSKEIFNKDINKIKLLKYTKNKIILRLE